MGCLAFVGRLDRSPYASFFDEGEWDKLAGHVSRDGWRLMGLPKDLPLSVCVEAGIMALPSLLKAASKATQFQVCMRTRLFGRLSVLMRACVCMLV